MKPESPVTYFAPAERASTKGIAQQSALLEYHLSDTSNFFDALPNIVLILNNQRQVIFANQILLDLLGARGREEIIGYRPGEILHCIHACELAGGCGTTEYCQTCGAINTILESLKGHRNYNECRITVHKNGQQQSMDLGITAIPHKIGSEQFTLLSIVDISNEKRRRILERIFFHDVMNTVTSVLGLAELLKDTTDPALTKEFLLDLHSSTKILTEQIQEQHELMQAENNDLKVEIAQMHSLSFLSELAAHCANLEVSRGKHIQLESVASDVVFVSSPQLLNRVLVNMLKNALEACKVGETARLGCHIRDKQIVFWVNNPGVIPREVQLQIFQRSFSTKGKDRGLGTYSMKLLTERYLKGSISFSVSEDKGTTFLARYPLKLDINEYLQRFS
ncbi:MAG: ATP-binding protein [Desulfotomaculaceae bacterium]|nr:ATP-binding protein [Desulfotomaculaceae bacterium]